MRRSRSLPDLEIRCHYCNAGNPTEAGKADPVRKTQSLPRNAQLKCQPTVQICDNNTTGPNGILIGNNIAATPTNISIGNTSTEPTTLNSALPKRDIRVSRYLSLPGRASPKPEQFPRRITLDTLPTLSLEDLRPTRQSKGPGRVHVPVARHTSARTSSALILNRRLSGEDHMPRSRQGGKRNILHYASLDLTSGELFEVEKPPPVSKRPVDVEAEYLDLR